MFHLLTACLCLIHHSVVLAIPLAGSEITRQQALSSAEFSYQVLISEIDERPKCGGVLVGTGYIVTSATCILDFGSIKSFLEEAHVHGDGTSLLFDLGQVLDAVIHPNYTLNPTSYDIAIVKFAPEEKGPHLKPANLNGTWNADEACIMSSWWAESNTWPDHLMWLPVSPTPCSPPPEEPNLICFAGNTTKFIKEDYGSPIICGGVLTGLVPQGGGERAINISSDIKWITETITSLEGSPETPESTTSDDTKSYLIQILQKLDLLAHDNTSASDGAVDTFTNWNNQVVIPLNYVLFAMVIFFFVLLFFIILFTIVLVYYSRK